VVALLAEAAIVKPNIKSAFAIMRKIVNTAIGRDVVEALAVYRTRILTTALAQRVVFAESIANGMTVLDLTRWDRRASRSCANRGNHGVRTWQGKQSRSQPGQSRHRMTSSTASPRWWRRPNQDPALGRSSGRRSHQAENLVRFTTPDHGRSGTRLD
jgi:hypothetical protein